MVQVHIDKNGFSKVLIELSVGVDSALVSRIVWMRSIGPGSLYILRDNAILLYN
ncbi:MAG: hypothetical protein REV36_03140 [Burkholderia sp.]|nr:hypothetical protein [Burkholderia sp.]